MSNNDGSIPNWAALLSPARVGKPAPTASDDVRSEFQRDFDRIVFASPFRRMQDKTQVFPLSNNDFTRTRLTHSIEVSCVGRSLGRYLSEHLDNELETVPAIAALGDIVAAACLAHDIGNPPFGHSGENAIQSWAKKNVGLSCDARIQLGSLQQVADLHDFEGNAQALRLVTKLYGAGRKGALSLTVATIGAMGKYPCGSLVDGKERNRGCLAQKKFGYFADDASQATETYRTLGMVESAPGAFRRHPLAYLVEAADDICYAIIDLEDAVDQHLVTAAESCRCLFPLAREADPKITPPDSEDKAKANLGRFRALSIHSLIMACAKVMRDKTSELLAGTFSKSLVESSTLCDEYAKVMKLVKNTAYVDRRVLQVELAGYKVISGLLDIFAIALVDRRETEQDAKYIHLFPEAYLNAESSTLESKLKAIDQMSNYQRVLAATDFVSGMTDTYALDLFQKLSGIKLPD